MLRPIDYELAQKNGKHIFLIFHASISGIQLYYGQSHAGGTDHPTAFLSKEFPSGQLSYHTYQQETCYTQRITLLGRSILGRKIILITDHWTLESVNTQRSMLLWQTSWYEGLLRFHHPIQSIKGPKNVVKDALSIMYAGQNDDIPVDNWVHVDTHLNPEGIIVPLDCLPESQEIQLWPWPQK